ncbi:hypothetical protein [Solicola gregarius]|uniref:Uncharacterized protein n=1 Tax=Solicola gregarius TaxID=2908642 RepID=A0AA46TGK7_9ACTN|nr:hypothetical protein [Solicola gregarius]UYM04936.1 hypothetical protein L0C25_20810 [Solicola gregarius]
MAKSMSLHANFAGIEQYGADVGSHGAENEGTKATAKAMATRACEELGYGAGSSQHGAVMRKLDSLFDEHIANVNLHKTGTYNAGDTMMAAGQRMQTRMSQTQI